MNKINFKREYNSVVAYRDTGMISHKMFTNESASDAEVEAILQWAYELGRRDRHWELQEFYKGRFVQPIVERL